MRASFWQRIPDMESDCENFLRHRHGSFYYVTLDPRGGSQEGARCLFPFTARRPPRRQGTSTMLLPSLSALVVSCLESIPLPLSESGGQW
ncbi:hypothetical protein NDU88_003482 [Pleurodeles waltl]|uniref:Uncharacterized protein n=1 Tax=Pleurodeles waltl TaxID=8319 RepID=A0AAV7UEF3_PLEWA|nr:hypothetical protein NDU88_003482 [Pleurodeles waltl]